MSAAAVFPGNNDDTAIAMLQTRLDRRDDELKQLRENLDRLAGKVDRMSQSVQRMGLVLSVIAGFLLLFGGLVTVAAVKYLTTQTFAFQGV